MALALLASLLLMGAADAAPPAVTCKDDPTPPPPLDAQIAACTAIIEGHPGHIERLNALLRRAEDYAMKGDAARAATDFAALNSGAFWGLLIQRGTDNDDRHDYDRAIVDFDEALRLSTRDDLAAMAHINRGVAYLNKGDFDKAIEDLETGLKKAKGDSIVWFDLGVAYFDKGDYRRAIDAFDASLTLKGANWQGWYLRGQAKFRSGDVAGAIADEGGAIKEGPREASPYNLRCWYRAVANRELDAAAEDCDQALKLKPETASYLDSRGFVRLRQGQFEEAIADFNWALRVNPRETSSLYLRGIAELRKGEREAGEKDIAEAKETNPGIADEYAGYGLTP